MEQRPASRFSRYISKAFVFEGRPQGDSVPFTLRKSVASSMPCSEWPRKAARVRLATRWGLSAGLAALAAGLSTGLSAGFRSSAAEAPRAKSRRHTGRNMLGQSDPGKRPRARMEQTLRTGQ